MGSILGLFAVEWVTMRRFPGWWARWAIIPFGPRRVIELDRDSDPVGNANYRSPALADDPLPEELVEATVDDDDASLQKLSQPHSVVLRVRMPTWKRSFMIGLVRIDMTRGDGPSAVLRAYYAPLPISNAVLIGVILSLPLFGFVVSTIGYGAVVGLGVHFFWGLSRLRQAIGWAFDVLEEEMFEPEDDAVDSR